MGNLAWSIGIFIIATFTKAWEPLSVALSQQRVPPFPFSALLVLCETSKLIATMPIIWHGGGCVAVASLFSRESAAMLAPPAALLAVCNFGLGYAVPRLDPMSYQVVFKAVSVCATALFSRLLLRRTLGWIRYAALAFLIVGAHLCSESPSHQSLRITSYEWRAGLGALLCGACALALSTVWFERVVMEQSDSAVHHTTAMALWGLAFNVIVLCTVGVSDAPQLSHADIFAAFSIAAADLSMSGFLALHGSNAYSYSRVLALLVSTAIAVISFDHTLTPLFGIGAFVVVASGWVYHEAEGCTRILQRVKVGYVYDALDQVPSDKSHTECSTVI